jgi:LysM repeat protein
MNERTKHVARRAGLLSLVVFLLAASAAPALAQEGEGSVTDLEFQAGKTSETVSTRLDSSDDKDFYRLYILAGQTLDAETSQGTGITVLDVSTQEYLLNETEGKAALTEVVPHAGYYIIGVYNSTTAGIDYTLTVTIPPVGSEGLIYTVQSGDTLYRISLRFGVTVAALRAANTLPGDLIYVGQRLRIPDSGSGEQPGSTTYVVQQGDTLYSIARRHGVTVSAIEASNDLPASGYIYPGMALTIPGRTYTVQQGDTLYSIAVRYGVTLQALAAANGITNPDRILVGQSLIIPG